MIAKLFKVLLVIGLASFSLSVCAQSQASRAPIAKSFKETGATQQPLYSEYKGVRIGMTAEQVRAKLGQPALKGDDQDYYIISEKEAVQIAYDAAHKVTGISVDYADAASAPDPKTVVGGELEMKNGSAYKLVRYESLGLWVSYNRSAGPVVIVTVTIQKMP